MTQNRTANLTVLLSNYFYFARSELLQRFQRGIEQGIGKRRIVNAQALVFLNKEVIPQSGCLGFGVISDDDRSLSIHQALGFQSRRNLIEFVLYLGLHAIDVQAGRVSVTALAGRNIWHKGVTGIRASTSQVAGYAGVFHHLVMRAGLSFNPTSAANAKKQCSFWAMVTTPVGAGNTDHTVRRFWEGSALLVAVGAQVAHTAIVGSVKRNECYRIGGF
jgi:hypothetical protein